MNLDSGIIKTLLLTVVRIRQSVSSGLRILKLKLPTLKKTLRILKISLRSVKSIHRSIKSIQKAQPPGLAPG